MLPYIDKTQKLIQKLIKDARENFSLYSIRVAIVAYREAKDSMENYEILNFVSIDDTDQNQKINDFLKQLKAKGNEDSCVDVIGGIRKATQLLKNIQGLTITFLFSAYPCHGKQYHSLQRYKDNYYDQVPENTLENSIQQYKKLNFKQYFNCIRITQHNDKMFNIMQHNFGEKLSIYEFEWMLREILYQNDRNVSPGHLKERQDSTRREQSGMINRDIKHQVKQSIHQINHKAQNIQENKRFVNQKFNSKANNGYFQQKKDANESKHYYYRPKSKEQQQQYGSRDNSLNRGNSQTRKSRFQEEVKQPSVNINIPIDQLHDYQNGKLTAEELLQQLLSNQQQQTTKPYPRQNSTNYRGGYRGKNFIPGYNRGNRGRGRGGHQRGGYQSRGNSRSQSRGHSMERTR
eukprot:403349047